MIIRVSLTSGLLIAYDNINSKSGYCGDGTLYYRPQRHLPLHDALCSVFAHSRKARRLALKETK